MSNISLIEHTFEWQEVKKITLEIARNKQLDTHLKLPKNRECMRFVLGLLENTNKRTGRNWSGGNTEDLLNYIQEGYNLFSESFEENEYPFREKRKFQTSDFEGDYNHDMFISGYDNFYSGMSKRQTYPGFDIVFNCFFNCIVSEHLIAEYKKWMLQTFLSLEASGIDVGLAIQFKSHDIAYTILGKTTNRDLWKDISIKIIVKRPNEAIDVKEWSCLLSPVALRSIYFFLLIIVADRNSLNTLQSLGRARSSEIDFNARYLPDKEIILIENPTNSSVRFIPSSLTKKFINAIEDAKRGNS